MLLICIAPLIFATLKSCNAQQAPMIQKSWDPNQGIMIKITSPPPADFVTYVMEAFMANNKVLKTDQNAKGEFVIRECVVSRVVFYYLQSSGMSSPIAREDLRKSKLHSPPNPGKISASATADGIMITVATQVWPEDLKVKYLAATYKDPNPSVSEVATSNPFLLSGCGYENIEVFHVNPCGDSSRHQVKNLKSWPLNAVPRPQINEVTMEDQTAIITLKPLSSIKKYSYTYTAVNTAGQELASSRKFEGDRITLKGCDYSVLKITTVDECTHKSHMVKVHLKEPDTWAAPEAQMKKIDSKIARISFKPLLSGWHYFVEVHTDNATRAQSTADVKRFETLDVKLPETSFIRISGVNGCNVNSKTTTIQVADWNSDLTIITREHPVSGIVILPKLPDYRPALQYRMIVIDLDGRRTVYNKDIKSCTANQVNVGYALNFADDSLGLKTIDLMKTSLHHPPGPKYVVLNLSTGDHILCIEKSPFYQPLTYHYGIESDGRILTHDFGNQISLKFGPCLAKNIVIFSKNPCGESSERISVKGIKQCEAGAPQVAPELISYVDHPILQFLPSEKVDDGIIVKWTYKGDVSQIVSVEVILYEGSNQILHQNIPTTVRVFKVDQCGVTKIRILTYNRCRKSAESYILPIDLRAQAPPMLEFLPSEKVDDGIIVRWTYKGDVSQISKVELHLYEDTKAILNQNIPTEVKEFKVDQCGVTKMEILTYNRCIKSAVSAVQPIDLTAENIAKCAPATMIPTISTSYTTTRDGHSNTWGPSFLLASTAILITAINGMI